MAKVSDGSGTVIIKKYANRRLYNTETSSYITLDHLAAMTREGRDFKVIDAKTEEDITHNVLTQIIMEEENRGQTMLPVNFLRQLISLYGDSMQSMVPQYLEASMDAFRRNQTQFRQAMEGAFAGGPLPRSQSATWTCSKLRRAHSKRKVGWRHLRPDPMPRQRQKRLRHRAPRSKH